MCCKRVRPIALLDGYTADETLDRLEDINKHCLTEFRKHWECLENNNQQLWQCRPAERSLNKCVFDNLVYSALQLR